MVVKEQNILSENIFQNVRNLFSEFMKALQI